MLRQLRDGGKRIVGFRTICDDAALMIFFEGVEEPRSLTDGPPKGFADKRRYLRQGRAPVAGGTPTDPEGYWTAE